MIAWIKFAIVWFSLDHWCNRMTLYHDCNGHLMGEVNIDPYNRMVGTVIMRYCGNVNSIFHNFTNFGLGKHEKGDLKEEISSIFCL